MRRPRQRGPHLRLVESDRRAVEGLVALARAREPVTVADLAALRARLARERARGRRQALAVVLALVTVAAGAWLLWGLL